MRRRSDCRETHQENKFNWLCKVDEAHKSIISSIEVLTLKKHERFLMQNAFPFEGNIKKAGGLYQVNNERELQNERGYCDAIIYEKIIITGSKDNCIKLWSFPNLLPLKTVTDVHRYFLETMKIVEINQREMKKFQTDSPYILISFCMSGEMKIWDIAGGMKPLLTLASLINRGIKTMDFFRTGPSGKDHLCVVLVGGLTYYMSLQGLVHHKHDDQRERHTVKTLKINGCIFQIFAGHLGATLYSWNHKKQIKNINSRGLNFIFSMDVIRLGDSEFTAIEKYKALKHTKDYGFIESEDVFDADGMDEKCNYYGTRDKKIGFIHSNLADACKAQGVKTFGKNTILVALAGGTQMQGIQSYIILISEVFNGQIVIKINPAHMHLITSLSFAFSQNYGESSRGVMGGDEGEASLFLISGSFDGKVKKWNLLSMADLLYYEVLKAHCLIESNSNIVITRSLDEKSNRQSLYMLVTSNKRDLIVSSVE
jgi:hypothetical protein